MSQQRMETLLSKFLHEVSGEEVRRESTVDDLINKLAPELKQAGQLEEQDKQQRRMETHGKTQITDSKIIYLVSF